MDSGHECKCGRNISQWIALKARSDWLVKLRISIAIYFRGTQGKMVSQFVSVTSEEIIQIIFCGVYYPAVLVHTKTTTRLSVGG